MRPRPQDDAQIMLASVRDPERFEAIFERHFEAIYRYFARRMGEDPGALASEVFCIAFDRRSSYDGRTASALPWLYGIARNVGANASRATWRNRQAAPLLARERGADAAIETLISSDRARLEHLTGDLARGLEGLGDDDRDSLLLMAWEDLSYAQIAVATNVPIGTVRSRIHRARRRLRTSLEGDAR